MPDVPIKLAASTGENTKDETVPPTKVALRQDVNPNTKPKNAPFLGPQNKAPNMTGMWIIVALIMPRGIYPRGV